MFRKLTNESLWNTDQLKGTVREDLYWCAEALKGMCGRDNNETHSILSIADWLFCYCKADKVNLPYEVEGLLLRPGMPPANFSGNNVQGTCIVIGHRIKKEN